MSHPRPLHRVRSPNDRDVAMSERRARPWHTGRMASTAVVPALCAVMCAAGLSAQNIPQRGFALAVDFMALDSRGNPVTDLRADEIVVRVGRETAGIRGLRLLPAAAA